MGPHPPRVPARSGRPSPDRPGEGHSAAVVGVRREGHSVAVVGVRGEGPAASPAPAEINAPGCPSPGLSGEGRPVAQNTSWGEGPRLVALCAWLVALLFSLPALAQDAAAPADAAETDAAAPAAAPTPEGSCQADPAPAGHAVTVETRVEPAQPTLGDRVIVTYRLFHNAADTLEFEPDPVAFAQPDRELEYARAQPDRDRSLHNAPGNRTYGEVAVAVQPFKSGEITIAPQLARLRASGDVVRVCTPAVHFRVRDPFGNEAHPRPRDVTPPQEVTEDALAWRWASLVLDGAFALVLATLGMSAYLRRRPRPVAPPPPPRPAWEVALEGLDAILQGDLLSRGLIKDYYDAISDVVRRYCGSVRGFDALEMTTDEVLAKIRKLSLPGVPAVEIEDLLRQCDLVKFARYVPPHEDSDRALQQAYAIVRRSSPAPPAGARPAAASPAASPGPAGGERP